MRLENLSRLQICVCVLFALPVSYGQTSIIPQVADGNGWVTTIVLTNRTTSTLSASLNFYREATGGATENWSLPFVERSSTQNLQLTGGGTLFLHTLGASSLTSVGWAELQASDGISSYAIFTQHGPGGQDQDGTAPAAASASRILVPFDNSGGFVTGLAVANPNAASQSISVSVKTDSGSISQTTVPAIPGRGHLSFSMPLQIPSSSGQRGVAEFYSSTGNFSIIALRFNPAGAFTAAPVYLETGAPIISSGPPAVPPSTVTFGAGRYLVGKDIPAGRYFTVPGGAGGCYWERLSGLGGSLAEIIANDFIGAGFGQVIVDVAGSDLAFSTTADCGTWYSTPRLGSQSSIPSGTWLVGAQIAPGTYQANANANCYWKRLSNFGGTLSAIIANKFVSSAGNQLVSISASDVGFSTTAECGAWTRVSNELVTSQSAATPAEVKQNWLLERSKDIRLQIPLSER